jgi:uncharacterized membrane protein HdeD (DUF308 family)
MAKKLNLTAILSIVAGILVLVFPSILAWAVGLYLVIVGLLDLKK